MSEITIDEHGFGARAGCKSCNDTGVIMWPDGMSSCPDCSVAYEPIRYLIHPAWEPALKGRDK